MIDSPIPMSMISIGVAEPAGTKRSDDDAGQAPAPPAPTAPPAAPEAATAPASPAPARRALPAEVLARLEVYLGRVDVACVARGIRPAERGAVAHSLREQFLAALAARVHREPTVADADEILAEMAPPETHVPHTGAIIPPAVTAVGPASPGPLPPPPPRPEPENAASAAVVILPHHRPDARLSLLALLGAMWASLFFLMLILSAVQIELPAGASPPRWLKILQYGLPPLGWSAPLATMVLGLIGIGQIHRSHGARYGLSLAVFDVLLFPLLLLDALILWLFGQFAGALAQQGLVPPAVAVAVVGQVLPVVVLILADYLLATRAWAAVQRKRR